MTKEMYLGIDMGGTRIKIAIVDDAGEIVEETSMDTDITSHPKNVLTAIVTIASKFANYKNIKSIGVGIAGDVDYNHGIVRFSPNMPKWKNVKLKEILETLTKKKVFVDNDANTAGIGAFYLDTKAQSTNLVCVTLGTGVGGGIIINKKLYRGTSLTAGEIGHITIDSDGTKCKCGNFGCIETFVGANYLSEYARNSYKENKSPIVDKLTNNNKIKISPKILFYAAKRGDKQAIEIWHFVGQKLGILLSILINCLNPDTIIFCGGVSQAKKFIMGSIKKEVKERAFQSAQKACKICVSKYTEKLGVVGAALLAKL